MGINEDAAPGAMSQDEAIQMVNVLPHNPAQIERRGPIFLADSDDDIASNEFVVGVAIHGKNMIVTYINDDGGGWTDYYRDPRYVYQQSPSAWEARGRYRSQTGGVLEAYLAAVTATNYTNDIAGTPDANILLPYGRTTFFEDICYWPSLSVENTYAKIASAPTLVSGTRLVAWAGTNKSTKTHANVSINVGSTTLTFGSDPGDIVGQFLTFDGDRTTTVPFAYLVTEEIVTNTTFRISKPYGLGESAAANKSGQAVQIRSRDIPIQSPAGVAACDAHLDRIFVGRALLRDSTGTIQAGYYPNALKWSQVLNPEKWPDANVTLVGSEPGDAIMGLASVGRYLLIFKNYSTWILAGDSEENFTVKRLLGNIGCIDSRSIVEYENGIIWASWQGIHMIDGSTLDVVNLTERKGGHGIRRTYQNAVGEYPGNIIVTAAADNMGYLHVHASSNYDALVNGTGETAPHDKFPMSCFIKTRAWTRLQNNSTAGGLRFAGTPKFFSCKPYRGMALGVAPAAVVIMDTATNPGQEIPNDMIVSFGNNAVVQGYDMVNTPSTSPTQTPYPVDVSYADLALSGDFTWSLKKISVHHLIEYQSDTTNASTVGAQIFAQFDPLETNTNPQFPNTPLGAVKARVLTSGTAGHTLYVTEVNPRSSSDEDALRGQFLRMRIYDTSSAPTSSWKIFSVVAAVEQNRLGRGTNHLL